MISAPLRQEETPLVNKRTNEQHKVSAALRLRQLP
jgi:hypothetical protein